MAKWVLFSFIVCGLGTATGQTVSGIVGDLVHDSSIEIYGSNFGFKESPAPVTWDNVEIGNFSDDWQSTNALSVGSESRHSNSEYCGTMNFQSGEPSGRG